MKILDGAVLHPESAAAVRERSDRLRPTAGRVRIGKRHAARWLRRLACGDATRSDAKRKRPLDSLAFCRGWENERLKTRSVRPHDGLIMNLTLPLARAALAACALSTAGCAMIGNARPAPTEADLVTIQPGMTRDQVLARVGPPTWTFRVWQEGLTIWNYRYSHSACLIYQVSMRPDGTVRDAGTAPDPACDGGNFRD
jgi:hypothetical protein